METNGKEVKEKKPRSKRTTKVVPIVPPSVQAPDPPKEPDTKKLSSNVPINHWEAQPDIQFAPPAPLSTLLIEIEADITRDEATIRVLEKRIAEAKRMREKTLTCALKHYDIKRDAMRDIANQLNGTWTIPQPPKKVSTQQPENS